MKRSRLNGMSKKRRAALRDREKVREAVFTRDGHECILSPRSRYYSKVLGGTYMLWDGRFITREAVLGVLGPCWGGISPHHLKKASGVGGYTEENLVTLCIGHNSAVEDHPREAQAMGLVIR